MGNSYSQYPSRILGRHQPPVRTHLACIFSGVYGDGIGVIMQPVITSPPRSRPQAIKRLRMVYVASPSRMTGRQRPALYTRIAGTVARTLRPSTISYSITSVAPEG